MTILKQFFMNKTVHTILIVVAVGVILYLVSKISREQMTNILADFIPDPTPSEDYQVPVQAQPPQMVQATDDQMSGAPVSKLMQSPGGEIHPEELLPKFPDAESFDQQHPTGQGDLSGKNFVTSGFNIGINTVGSSLRNANLQIRSEPANPIVSVSPWQNSSITPDWNQKTFEIGQ